MSSRTNVAAGPGFEPGQTDPKSVVLPLHNPASLHLPRKHYSMVASGWQLGKTVSLPVCGRFNVVYSLRFGKLRIDGNMVLSEYVVFVFALCERKNEND